MVSNYDREIKAAGGAPGELEELLLALGQPAAAGSDRHDALAHYLSGEEGWRDALKRLRGTFAGPSRSGTG